MLVYNPPSGSYTTKIPPGTAAFRDVLADVFGISRVEVIRSKSRCRGERSEHCESRGIDYFTTDPKKLRAIFDFCVTHAEALGIQSVIANRMVWGFGVWRERAYTGPSPHIDHAHTGLTIHAAQKLTESFIRSLLTQPPTTEPTPVSQEEPMQGRSLRTDHSKVEILLSGPKGQQSWVQIVSANDVGPRQSVSGTYYVESPGSTTVSRTFICDPNQSGIYEVEVSEWFRATGNKILVTAENGEGKPLSIWGR